MSRVNASFPKHCHLLRSWKEPGQEVHRCDGHANSEHDSGEHPLVPALTKRKHQATDGNKAQSFGNRASECGLKLLDSVFPRAVAGCRKISVSIRFISHILKHACLLH